MYAGRFGRSEAFEFARVNRLARNHIGENSEVIPTRILGAECIDRDAYKLAHTLSEIGYASKRDTYSVGAPRSKFDRPTCSLNKQRQISRDRIDQYFRVSIILLNESPSWTSFVYGKLA